MRIDEAVGMLRLRGIIDEKSPVGLVGFSRSGFYVHYIATHPGKTRISAAVVFDSVTHSFGESVVTAALDGPYAEASARLYGKEALPFWWNKTGWLDAPSFNLDRLTTPMLFTHNADSAWMALETIGSFRLARRPFDYHLFTDAGHMEQASRQRAAAMQSTVDWMSFWMKSKDPESNPDDPTRTERWHAIRTDWEKEQKEEADWKAARH